MILISRLSPARRILPFVVAVGLALALAACGRRGDPLPPPDPSATPSPSANPNDPAAFSHPKPAPITPKKTPFALDPLL